jgi:hypothetical protein
MFGQQLSAYSCGGSSGFTRSGCTGFPLSFRHFRAERTYDDVILFQAMREVNKHIKISLYVEYFRLKTIAYLSALGGVDHGYLETSSYSAEQIRWQLRKSFNVLKPDHFQVVVRSGHLDKLAGP